MSRPSTVRVLLAAGAIAGPAFTLAWLVEGATRAHYDPWRHPISSLSIGELGWTQSATFIVTGLLTLAFAFGLRRRLPPVAGSTWGPRLIGIVAIGLIGAGVFVTDPMNGYPPGTPALPLHYTLPGRLHRILSALVFLGLPGACFAFTQLFSRRHARGWTTYSAITGLGFVVMFVVTSVAFAQVGPWVNDAGLLQRITLTIGWAWLTLLALHILNAPAEED